MFIFDTNYYEKETIKNSYNVDIIQVNKKMTLENLALIVSGIGITIAKLSATVEQGFKKW
ncbi:MAG: hypothetical protein KFW07_00695 [Mycoplasmataceae bacterium]|nr:hypothetical protein [Mycoplasmataceae bacterium]